MNATIMINSIRQAGLLDIVPSSPYFSFIENE